MLLAFIHMPQILVVTAAALAWLMYFPWHKSIHELMLKLSEEAHEDDDSGDMTICEFKRRIKALPKVVQDYFMKAVSLDTKRSGDELIVPFVRSLRMEQEGRFLLSGKFKTFTASQEFTTRFKHAGFVWDAVIETNDCLPAMHVCDAYIKGAGMMRATAIGVPVMNMKSNSPEINQGELMRWAAEATLFPLALLPTTASYNKDDTEEVSLKWRPRDDSSAILDLKHHGTEASLVFNFDPDTHLVTSVQAKRPRAVKGNNYEMTLWEAYCHDYEIHGGLLVPTRMKAGWKLEDTKPPEIYFEGRNHNFVYLVNHPRHACEAKHEYEE